MEKKKKTIAYLCDRKKCDKCSYPRCKYTLDINHAVNFNKVTNDVYEYKEDLWDRKRIIKYVIGITIYTVIIILIIRYGLDITPEEFASIPMGG